ncbi:hypothetical protein [Tessaracoccus sp. Y1736]
MQPPQVHPAGGALPAFAFRGAGLVRLDDHLLQQGERGGPTQPVLPAQPPVGDGVGRLGGQLAAQVGGLAGPPGLDAALLRRRVQPGVAVLQVQGVGEFGGGHNGWAAQQPGQFQSDEL